MPNFSYKGRNRQGKVVSGTISVSDKKAVITTLRQEGIVPINIEETAGATEQLPDILANFKNMLGNPGLEDLIIFSRQMYSLTKAGVPITKAISVVKESATNEKLTKALSDIIVGIESGKSLADSMSKHIRIFPTLMRALINVGENTGALDEVFKQISAHLQREGDTKKRIKGAMRYPIMVIITIVVAIGVINLAVVPAFANFFKSFGAELPLPTRILIASSNFMINYWYIVILLIGAMVGGWIAFLKTPAGEMLWDRFKTKIPLIGTIIERSLLARFARSFSLTFRTGVPLLQSIEIIANTTDNVYIAAKIMNMRERIERGESLSAAARACGMFSTLVLQMITIGEETGEVDKLLDEVADFYEQELEYDLKALSGAIEPILIAIVAVMVLILALGVFLPMWDISQVALGK